MPNPNQTKRYCLVALFLVLAHVANAQFYYGTMQDFGKKRAVFNQFDWNFYRFAQYDIFFYNRGIHNAQYIAHRMPTELYNINEYFGLMFENRFQVISFNSLTDLKQSNLISNTEENYGQAGVTRVIQNNILLYGEGRFTGLDKQIRAGLAEVVMNYIATGGNPKADGIDKSNLPMWLTKGFVEYYADPQMSPEMAERIKDGIITRRLKKFSSVSPDDARTLGYSIFYYLGDRYGKDAVASVVVNAIVLDNAEKALKQTLGISSKDIHQSWTTYFKDMFTDVPVNKRGRIKRRRPKLDNIIVKGKYDQKLYHFTQSESTPMAAYSINEAGEFALYLKNMETGRKKRIYRGGFKIPQNEDLSLPLMSWKKDGTELAFISEEQGDVFLNLYDAGTRKIKKQPLSALDKVISLDYSPDGSTMLLSGVVDGYSDIYLYNIKNEYLENITQDSYSDFDATFLNTGEVAFVSDRINDTISPTREFRVTDPKMNIYVYNLQTKSKVLKRITPTEQGEVKAPVALPGNMVGYLATDDKNRESRYGVRIDSVISQVDTVIHYRPDLKYFSLKKDTKSVLAHDASRENDAFTDLVYYSKGYKILKNDNLARELFAATENNPVHFDPKIESFTEKKKEEKTLLERKYEVDLNNYVYEKEMLKRFNAPSSVRDQYYNDSTYTKGYQVIERNTYEPFKRIYRNTYFAINLMAEIDNSSRGNDNYQAYTGGPVFLQANLGGLIGVTIADRLKNHIFTFGFSTDFQTAIGYALFPNSEYLLSYDNMNKRLKKGISYNRITSLGTGGDFTNIFPQAYPRISYTANIYKVNLSYPVSEVGAINTSIGFRNDRYLPLSIDNESMKAGKVTRNYVLFQLNYTYNNTYNIDLNLPRGFKFKVFADLYQGIYGGEQTMINLGFDARHYTRVHKNIVWANRIAFGTSVGNLKLIHYLGGVDNAFGSKFNYSNPPDPSYNWGFQTLASNMRGFVQNIRYGSSFALLNTELRFPLFQYIFSKPIKLGLLRHFQIVPFFDAGTAWRGLTPWARENAYLKYTINEYPLVIDVNKKLDPFIYGYGVGLRTKFLGYFIRADWAWGHDTGYNLPMQFYISLGLDF